MDTPRIADAARALRHIFVRDLMLEMRIGVYTDEHEAPQRVRVNIDLGVEDDGARAGSRSAIGRDEIGRVVDYAAIAAATRRIAGEGHIRLVETFSERIAELCLRDARVHVARIRVEKLDVMADAGSVGVEIERRRG